jgi:hypothetical protein
MLPAQVPIRIRDHIDIEQSIGAALDFSLRHRFVQLFPSIPPSITT